MSLLNKIAIALLLVPCLAFGQTITGSSGTFDDGTSYTIGGTGFGTKTTAAPAIWDDLSHAVYSGLSDGDPIPVRDNGFPTAPIKDMWNCVYEDNSSNLRVVGSPVFKANIAANSGGLKEIGRPNNNHTYLYLDYWYYSESILSSHPSGYKFNKIGRVWPTTLGNWGHASIYPGRVAYEASTDVGLSDYGNIYPTEGVWTHIAGWYDSSLGLGDASTTAEGATNGHGIVKYWSNNVQVIDIDDLGLRDSTTDGSPPPSHADGYTHIETLGSEVYSGHSHAGFENMWGDLYIDDTLSRVMLGDNPVWSNVRHYEMQIPSSWSTTQISFEVNTGSFVSNDTAWLFVSDSNGNVGAGFPVVIGASGGGLEPVALTAPTNLQVNGGN